MDKELRIKKHILEAINSVKDCIDRNPLKKKCISDLAVEAGIGRNTLQSGFKRLFGMSINEYRLEKIMDMAKSMLEEDRLSIKQIAYKCGYRSQGNFTASFRNKYQKTPKEYQYQSLELVIS